MAAFWGGNCSGESRHKGSHSCVQEAGQCPKSLTQQALSECALGGLNRILDPGLHFSVSQNSPDGCNEMKCLNGHVR